ncbi:MAG: putative lipid II flippase FtsW [Limnochordales bacterium]|nr:putative lipid II flippase FtsW [Limnochordales bacterium]
MGGRKAPVVTPALPTVAGRPAGLRQPAGRDIPADRSHRPSTVRAGKSRPDTLILLPSVALLVIGLLMVFSASSVQALYETNDAFYYAKRQFLGAALGLVAMAVLSRIDYRRLRWLAWPGLLVTVALLVAVLFVGREVAGARRWIPLGPINLQPSELAKLGLILFLAAWLDRRRDMITSFWSGYLPPLLLTGLLFGLVMLEPDLGTGITLGAIAMVMLFATGASGWHILLTGFLAIPVVALLIWIEPYRLRRIMGFIDPWADPLDSGFQTIQSLLAVGSGGLFGTGLGQSRQKYFYLPEQHTDFIFGIVGEELGFLGAVLVVLFFFILCWRGLRAALRAPDFFGMALATGLTALIGVQAFLNMGVVTGLLPVTGITLPFLSYGSSSLVVTLAAVGILLNISRQGEGP